MQEGLEPKQNKKRFLKSSLFFTWEIIKIIIISLAIIIPVRYFLIQPFFVNGASMEPQFHDGEYLIIDELSYRFNKPQRGEVIVFKYPKAPSQYYIKRIIGLPNEKIKIDQGKIIIFNDQNPNGFILNENNYLSVDGGGTFLLETKLEDAKVEVEEAINYLEVAGVISDTNIDDIKKGFESFINKINAETDKL